MELKKKKKKKRFSIKWVSISKAWHSIHLAKNVNCKPITKRRRGAKEKKRIQKKKKKKKLSTPFFFQESKIHSR